MQNVKLQRSGSLLRTSKKKREIVGLGSASDQTGTENSNQLECQWRQQMNVYNRKRKEPKIDTFFMNEEMKYKCECLCGTESAVFVV